MSSVYVFRSIHHRLLDGEMPIRLTILLEVGNKVVPLTEPAMYLDGVPDNDSSSL